MVDELGKLCPHVVPALMRIDCVECIEQVLGKRDSEITKYRALLEEEIRENDKTEKNLNETIDSVIARLEPLRLYNHNLKVRLAEAKALLERVTLDAMGGTPDLFGPDSGWDTFDLDVCAFISSLDKNEQ